jgi:hypothetical protein
MSERFTAGVNLGAIPVTPAVCSLKALGCVPTAKRGMNVVALVVGHKWLI